MEPQSFLVSVVEVHSGDDLVLLVDLGVDSLYKRVRARLYGVDAPKAFRAPAHTEGGKVRERLRSFLEGRRCRIDLHVAGKGGWLVTLWASGDEEAPINVNKMLISEGFVYQREDQ